MSKKTYTNPIKKQGDFADPFVMKYNGKYYLYCTNPRVKCWSSDNLIDWNYEGEVIPESEFPELVPFAPEVIYENGFFYMYTSPHGLGHYVLQANNPLGPFIKITENIGHSIDFSVFIDDDGKKYAFWADEKGILGCEMSSPYEFGESVYVEAFLDGWTEGPFVVKIDKRYYLTYTGNHYLSKGYRVNAAYADSPLGPYHDIPYNPLIISTAGKKVGLGHSSTVCGPDLTTYYIFYHNLNPDRTRDLNLDAVEYIGSNVFINGPGGNEKMMPERPLEEYRFLGDNWKTEYGEIVRKDGFTYTSERYKTECRCQSFRDAEFNLCLDGQKDGEYGVYVKNNENCFLISISSRENKIYISSNKTKIQKKLLLHTDHFSLHRLSIQQGKILTIYFDSYKICELPEEKFNALGYIGTTKTKIGYTAVSDSKIFRYNIPAKIPTNKEIILEVEKEQEYHFAISSSSITSMKLSIDSHEYVFDKRKYINEIFLLEAGLHKVRVESDELSLCEIYPQENHYENGEKKVFEITEKYTKEVFGKEYSNCKIRITFKSCTDSDEGEIGLLFRASELSDGSEGNDKRLGTNFFVGYRIAIKKNKVKLSKHRYTECVLEESVFSADDTDTLEVRAENERIMVIAKGKTLIDFCDIYPINHGFTGIHTRNACLNAIVEVSEINKE